MECPVCLDSLEESAESLPCGHLYCTGCIKDLTLLGQIECAKCRQEFSMYFSSSNVCTRKVFLSGAGDTRATRQRKEPNSKKLQVEVARLTQELAIEKRSHQDALAKLSKERHALNADPRTIRRELVEIQGANAMWAEAYNGTSAQLLQEQVQCQRYRDEIAEIKSLKEKQEDEIARLRNALEEQRKINQRNRTGQSTGQSPGVSFPLCLWSLLPLSRAAQSLVVPTTPLPCPPVPTRRLAVTKTTPLQPPKMLTQRTPVAPKPPNSRRPKSENKDDAQSKSVSKVDKALAPPTPPSPPALKSMPISKAKATEKTKDKAVVKLYTGSEIKWTGYGCPSKTAVPACTAKDGSHNFSGRGSNRHQTTFTCKLCTFSCSESKVQ